MSKEIVTANAPKAIGPYSQGIVAGNLIFTSGQIPINPETGEIVFGIEEQTKQVLNNLKGILEAEGAGLESIIKTTIFVKDLKDFATVNSIYESFLTKPYPARSTVEVARLPKDVLIEIEAVALKE